MERRQRANENLHDAGQERAARVRAPWGRLLAGVGWLLAMALASSATAQIMVFGGPEEEQTGRSGFAMPQQTVEIKEAFEDFAKYRKRGQWEKAFQTIKTLRETAKQAMLPTESGFYVAPFRRVQDLLLELPPDGKEAYRLFYDAEAKKLLQDAQGKKELPNLTKIVEQYLVSSVGQEAADRLGDLEFERGELEKAIEWWQAALRNQAQGTISPAWIQVKLATAYARLGRWENYREVAAAVRSRFASDEVVIAGKKQTAVEYLGALEKRAPTPNVAPTLVEYIPSLKLPKETALAWRFTFYDEETIKLMGGGQEMFFSGYNQRLLIREWIPPTVSDERRLYVHLLGRFFALDLKTGKLVWRSEKFHDLRQQVQSPGAHYVEYLTLRRAGGKLWALAKPKESDQQQRYWGMPLTLRLLCLDPDNGQTQWDSSQNNELKTWTFTAAPLVVGDTVYSVGYKQQQAAELYALALRAKDGKLLWSGLIGTQTGNQGYYMQNTRSAIPELLYERGKLYLETHTGGLLELDSATGKTHWGLLYETQLPNPNYWDYRMQSGKLFAAPLVLHEGILYTKGMRADRLLAIDVMTPKVLWQRPVNQTTVVAGLDDQRLYFGGEEVMAMDRATRKLLWATRVPDGSCWSLPVVGANAVYQFTPRGIYEMDKTTGDVRTIFRGTDLDSEGGKLFVTKEMLITVSNRGITAYPLSDPATKPRLPTKAAATTVEPKSNPASTTPAAARDANADSTVPHPQAKGNP